MAKKRVKFSDNLVSEVFEFVKDYPHELNHLATATNAMKRPYIPLSNSSITIEEKLDQELITHFQDLDRVETGNKSVDFTGCLLDSDFCNNRLDINKITGQEFSTITHDGDTIITPFNLNDEMEYGHFDGTGNFVFRKEKNDLQDNWFDSVDWDRVKEPQPTHSSQKIESLSCEESKSDSLDVGAMYTQIMNMLNDKETILKAIIRYGKDKSQKSNLEKLTELADELLTDGEVNVYEFSKEIIQHKLSKINSIDEDEDLESAFNHEPQSKCNPELNGDTTSSDAPLWEYKWDCGNGAEVYGPFTTKQMANWKNSGYFQSSIYCRKVLSSNSMDSQLDFHSSDRIDFDLYL